MSHSSILISVAPAYAAAIAEGAKTVELRRRFPEVAVGTWLYIYTTLPIGAVMGRVRIKGVERDNIEVLWSRFVDKISISRSDYDAYFAGRSQGMAILLGRYEALPTTDLHQLRELLGSAAVPQSYRYLSADLESMLVRDITTTIRKTSPQSSLILSKFC